MARLSSKQVKLFVILFLLRRRFLGFIDLFCGCSMIEGIDWSPILSWGFYLVGETFYEEEIRVAVFDMEGDKAPGPDSFTMAFN